MNKSKPFVLYLNMPVYLAQWYADMCESTHAASRNEPYEHTFYELDRKNPKAIQPIKSSFPSDVLKHNLDRQPEEISVHIPEDATIAILIPNYPGRDSSTYNYLSDLGKREFINAVRDEFYYDFAKFILPYLGRLPRTRNMSDTLEAYMMRHGINPGITKNCEEINTHYMRRRQAYYDKKRKKHAKSKI